MVFLAFLFCFSAITNSHAQDSTRIDTTRKMIPVDSLARVAEPISNEKKIDSVLKYHSPKKAAFRSAVIPGWGQAYNKKYWKIPIVWGALGVSGSIFVYNLTQYKDLRFAYTARVEASTSPGKDANGQPLPPDSTKYWQIRPDLVHLDLNAVRSYRDDYRRNIDYSALFFILLWGLNVVDATVDAHLKTFDVSPDLSFRFKFGKSEFAGTSGVSFIVAFK